jgi:hypothetical protein
MPTWLGTTNSNWSNPANWDTNAIPTDTTDAIFTSANNNPCVVDIAGVCRNLNFNGGAGYSSTITMSNPITVGATSNLLPGHSVTLSSGMIISPAGTAPIITRGNGTTTLTSNGKLWPNAFNLNTSPVVTFSSVTLVDNWSVGSLVLGPAANHELTIQGAFNFTVNGNFEVRPVGVSARITGVSAATLPTFVLAGTGTWSTSCTFVSNATAITEFGVNVTINAPTKTVTIADNCFFGGNAITGATLRYVAGTVITNGTFYLLGRQSQPVYNVDVSGSSSLAATTTNTAGINFNNLTFRTSSTGAPQLVNIINNICVLGDLRIAGIASASGPISTSGGTIYAHKSLILASSSIRNPSTTIVKLVGTGTWSDSYVNGTFPGALGVTWGVSWQLDIDTTGTITLNSNVGVWFGGRIKYTQGTFVTTGRTIIIGNNATIENFGSTGPVISNLVHITGGTTASTASYLNFLGTTATRITNLSFAGFSGNNSHLHLGNIGWTCDNFDYQPTLTAANFRLGLQALVGVEYTVTTNLIMRHFRLPSLVTPSGLGLNFTKNPANTIPRAIFTLLPGASQDVYAVDALDIDSSRGQTVWNRKGLITNTINWELWDYPKTVSSTFTI